MLSRVTALAETAEPAGAPAGVGAEMGVGDVRAAGACAQAATAAASKMSRDLFTRLPQPTKTPPKVFRAAKLYRNSRRH